MRHSRFLKSAISALAGAVILSCSASTALADDEVTLTIAARGGSHVDVINAVKDKFEKENSRMKGIAVVTLDDCFVVKGIRIIDGDNGLFIAMPSKTTASGEHSDIAHPINKETRQMFEEAIIKAYNEAE